MEEERADTVWTGLEMTSKPVRLSEKGFERVLRVLVHRLPFSA